MKPLHQLKPPLREGPRILPGVPSPGGGNACSLSKRGVARAAPTAPKWMFLHSAACRRNQGPAPPPRAPLRPALCKHCLGKEAGASQKRPEFTRNHSGSVETQRNSHETTAGASKRRPRPTACAVAAGNLSGPPRKIRSGIIARNHSRSIETQRNSRETTVGASKRSKAPPHRVRRYGPQPISGPPRRG